MKKTPRPNNIFELLISFGVLAIILYYSFLLIYVLPYSGLRFRSDTGEITQVFTKNTLSPAILPGDTIIKVNDFPGKNISE